MSVTITPGTRVRSRQWDGYDGTTLTGVDPDGYVTVQWDRARFSQDQQHVTELAVLPADVDQDQAAEHTARYAAGWYCRTCGVFNLDSDPLCPCPAPPPPAPAGGPASGTCPWCEQPQRLTFAGRISTHTGDPGQVCPGGGSTPAG